MQWVGGGKNETDHRFAHIDKLVIELVVVITCVVSKWWQRQPRTIKLHKAEARQR